MTTAVRPVHSLFLTTFILLISGGVVLNARASGFASASNPESGTQAQQSSQNSDDPLQRPLPKQKKKKGSSTRGENDYYRKWADDEVGLIITPEEREAFRRLGTNAERDRFIEQFWVKRDPTPDTEENEYKDEYYRRVAYADERFSAGIPGRKTDRGRMYILHGPPDSIESHPMGGPYLRPAEDGGGQTITHPFEVWRYRRLEGIAEEVEIEFVDTCGCGEYHRTPDRGEKDISTHVPGVGPTDQEAMHLANQGQRLRGGIETLGPSFFDTNRESKEFERMELDARLEAPPPIKFRDLHEQVVIFMHTNPLPFDVHVDYVKLASGLALAPITIQVANRELTYINKDGVQRASVNIYGRLTTLTGKVVQSFEDPVHLDVPAALLPRFVENVSLYQKAVPLPPGRYRLDIVLKDVNGNKLGAYGQGIVVPDFGGDAKLAASSLIVADVMEPLPAADVGTGSFVIGPDKVRPRVESAGGKPPVFKRDQKVNLWIQVYNLATDEQTRKPSATVEYQIVNTATHQPVLQFGLTPEQMGNAGRQWTLERSLAAGQLAPGAYEVTIKVNDLISKQTIAPASRFVIE